MFQMIVVAEKSKSVIDNRQNKAFSQAVSRKESEMTFNIAFSL